jgi:Uma2 family endonuclease
LLCVHLGYADPMGARTLISFREFAALPDEPGKQELFDGELVTMPPPKLRHTRIQHAIARLIQAAIGSSGNEVYIEPGFRLSANTYLTPDVAFIRAEQLATADPDDYLQGAPALAVEVASESNTAVRLDQKVKDYLAHGSEEVWVVYPETRRVWVYRKGENSATVYSDSIATPLFPGHTFDVASMLE